MKHKFRINADMIIGIICVAIGAFFYFTQIGKLPEKSQIFPKIAFLIFTFLSAINIVLWFFWQKKLPKQNESDEADRLNNRAAALVGNIYTLTLPIEQGATRMEIAGSEWTVCGADLAAGTKVKVVKVVGLELFVEAV